MLGVDAGGMGGGRVVAVGAGVDPGAVAISGWGEGVAKPEEGRLGEVPTSAGLPKRSTLSRAADMIALPNVVGSNRAWRFEVLTLAAEESCELRVDVSVAPVAVAPVCTIKGVSNGEDCGRLVLRGEARWAWKRSRRWD